jgi:uncharacterized membrane protein YphA (DoxX/SURF4 family)
MMNVLSSRFLQFPARVLLGLVFVVASIDKIAAPDAFAASIEAYHVIPTAVINLMAITLPWIELFIGVFLIGGVSLRGSALLATILLAVFSVAIISALLRGLTIDCGCFGKEHATPVSWMKVGEDVGMIVVSLLIYFFTPSHPSRESQASLPSGSPG